MKTIPKNIRERLLFILHRGLTEIRNLALREGNEQIAELADALEIVPGHALNCPEDKLELIRYALQNYQAKFPESAYNHVAYLDQYDPPDRY